MRHRTLVAVWVTALVAGPAVLVEPALASADDHLIVGGITGLSVGTGSGGDFGIRVGADVSPAIRLSGEVHRLPGALPAWARAAIEQQAAALAGNLGDTVKARADLRAFEAIGTLRGSTKIARHAALYLEAGAGVARLSGSFQLSVGDPASGAGGSSSQIPHPLFAGLPRTSAMAVGGGGVTIATNTRVSFDLGYRFSRVFAGAQLGRIDSHRVYAAMQIGF